MRRVAPSVLAREDLRQLVAGGAGHQSNIVSALVQAVTRLVPHQATFARSMMRRSRSS